MNNHGLVWDGEDCVWVTQGQLERNLRRRAEVLAQQRNFEFDFGD
jgi:hypothetical protein